MRSPRGVSTPAAPAPAVARLAGRRSLSSRFRAGLRSRRARRACSICFCAKWKKYARAASACACSRQGCRLGAGSICGREVAAAHGLRRQPSLPTALLDIRFDSLDDYLRHAEPRHAQGHAAQAQGVQRAARRVARQYRRHPRRGHAPVSRDLRARRPDIRGTDRRIISAACCANWVRARAARPTGSTTGWSRSTSCCTTDERLLDKFLGMDYDVAREYNLYFFTWMENVRYCIEHGSRACTRAARDCIAKNCASAAGSSRTGCGTVIAIVCSTAIFAAVERLFRLDRHDPELAALNPAATGASRRAPLAPRAVAAWCVLLGFAGAVANLAQVRRARIPALSIFPRARSRSPWVRPGCGFRSPATSANSCVWMTILRKSQPVERVSDQRDPVRRRDAGRAGCCSPSRSAGSSCIGSRDHPRSASCCSVRTTTTADAAKASPVHMPS